MEDWQSNLVTYGTHLLAAQLGQAWPLPETQPPPASLAETVQRRADLYEHDPRLRLSRQIVRDGALDLGLKSHQQMQSVTSIFSLLTTPPGVFPSEWTPVPLAPLDTSQSASLGPRSEDENFSPADLWKEFWTTMRRLPAQSEFDTFFFLLARQGWNVPGTVSDALSPGFEHGISVFEQFKAVAALCHCLDPTLEEGVNQPISLIAGDLPGIQRVLYTITAKGAAKTLRGHSAYLQLLSDALVRLALQHLDLPWASVVFSAGGNFMIAAPHSAIQTVESWHDRINQKLLDLHRGELYLALAWSALPARLYAEATSSSEPSSLVEKRAELQRRLEASKHAAFARLAPAHYAVLFEPIGDGGGGERCDVCHVEVDGSTQVPESEGELLLCEQCHSYAFPAKPTYDSLAWSVANANRVFISTPDQPASLDKYRHGKGNPPWTVALRALGLDYQFLEPGDSAPAKQGSLLAFDPAKFLPSDPDTSKSYGFRFLSQLTPREDPSNKEIRDFHNMARQDAIGIPRFGVLRMDVDGLGQTMSGRGLTYPDLLHLSALSNALDLFFGGMLDQIGRDCADAWQEWTDEWSDKKVSTVHKWPYVIYAGGDDLFVVAPWDLLPPLAQAIQERFDAFCLGRLTMSAGIAIAREKYPLYRAAEQAGLMLDQSKDRVVEDERTMLITARKNALTFLGVTLPWDEVAQARDLAQKLTEMLSGYPHGDKAPRALLQLLYYVARLYRREAGPGDENVVKLGQWLPALHYGLRRMQRRAPKSLKAELVAIPNHILNLDAVRSAGEPLQALDEKIRKKKKQGKDIAAELQAREQAEVELSRAVRTKLGDTRRDWPVIRYLGLPVRWAEFLTRKED
jgi:CRISPR-associated protein Cas10/Csm1 subtype III-A